MSRTAAQKLLEEARKLPPDYQAWLAYEFIILRSELLELHPEWDGEIKRRLDEIDSGKVEMIPHELVRERMLARLSPKERARFNS